MYVEHDPRAISVLSRALVSRSRAIRLRAVAMLANVECPRRAEWLEAACDDRDGPVRETAGIVSGWVACPAEPCWPAREDPAFDTLPRGGHGLHSAADGCARHGWEYVVEVWREDGHLVGAYFAAGDEEDDVRAKHMAMGQAVLANAGRGGEVFDPEMAAAFIVSKRHVLRGGESW